MGGQFPATAPFDVSATSARETEPAVGAGYSKFTVGYMSAPTSAPSAQDVYAAVVHPHGTVESTNVPVHALNGPLQRGLRASSWTDVGGLPDHPNTVMFGMQIESDSIGLLEQVRFQQFDPVAGSANAYGQGCPGPGSTLPMIGTTGSPYPGNSGFGIELDGAPPFSLAVLLIGNQLATLPIPGAPGCTLYMDFPLVIALPEVTSVTGTASVDLPIPSYTPAGAVLACQWAIYTPGWNPFGWIASADIDLVWQ